MSGIKTGDMQGWNEYLARQQMVLFVSVKMFLPDVDVVSPYRASKAVP
jgi:hypothetical protein